jgi:hypothetical protein
MTAIASLWVAWSSGEFFYEGWGNPMPGPFLYFVPGVLALGLLLAAIRWPFAGGALLAFVGGTFGACFVREAIQENASPRDFATRFLVSGAAAVVGLLFVYEGANRRRKRAAGANRIWYIVALVPPLAILIGFLVFWTPILAARQDDGDRGARLVEGNGVRLVWAPEGPGWNWKQDFGGYPSWESLALYGAPPVGLSNKRERSEVRARGADMQVTGLCRHLSEDGLRLEETAVNVWRLPSADELVRSLGIHGENAGCVPSSTFSEAPSSSALCTRRPDKETPLWAPDREPIYYWVLDEWSEDKAFYVNYQGSIQAQPTRWGNPRHGYRCVRDPVTP